MKTVDLQIDARWVAPVLPATILDHHSVVIDDGKILEICPTARARLQYQPKKLQSLPQHLLTPGFFNLHNHAAMTLLRGMGSDLPLQRWLEDAIWPAENRFVDADFVALGSRWSMAEMLAGGVTTFSDQYFYPDAVAEQAIELGLRVQLATPVIDFPTAWASGMDEGLKKTVALNDRFKGHARVFVALGPHAPYTVSDESFGKVRTLADQLDLRVQCHVQETESEVQESLKAHGMRPMERLEKLGMLGPDFQAVHVVAIDDSDIERLARNNCSAVTCPDSNLKLASGLCPTDRLLKAGVNLCIGTDGAASNNDQDLLSEARNATLIAKGGAYDATAMNLQQTLYMMTLAGAKALGLDDRLGTLEAGKQADLVALDLSDPFLKPFSEPLSAVFYNHRARVDKVWIEGHLKVESGRPAGIDLNELSERAQAKRREIEEAIK